MNETDYINGVAALTQDSLNLTFGLRISYRRQKVLLMRRYQQKRDELRAQSRTDIVIPQGRSKRVQENQWVTTDEADEVLCDLAESIREFEIDNGVPMLRMAEIDYVDLRAIATQFGTMDAGEGGSDLPSDEDDDDAWM